jgi:hypothetical protein
MRTRPIYREGKLLAETPTGMLLTKTLSSTGEHDLWGGAAATAPSTLGDVLELVSSSAQDDAAVTDTWTATFGGGSDLYLGVDVAGVSHAGLSAIGLAAAINNGTKESWGIFVIQLPTAGEGIDITIGTATYQWLRDTEATIDEAATAIAAILAADPLYDCAARGGGSGAIACTAKLPNSATADIVVDLTDDGDIVSDLIFPAGEPSATHSAVESGGDVVITADTAGVAMTVAAETDLVTMAHTLTGGAGTGAQSVLVTYIDTDGYYQQEVVALNGTTAVETVGEASKLLHLQAFALGSGGAAAGNITCGVDGETAVATLAAGDTEIHRLMWAVPNQPGCKWAAVYLRGSNTSSTAATLRLRVSGGTGTRLVYATGVPANSSVTASLLDTPIEVGPGESIKATLEGNGATVICELLGYSEGV